MDQTRIPAARLHRSRIGHWALSRSDTSHWRITQSRLDGLRLVDVNMASLHLEQTVVTELAGVGTSFEGSLMAHSRLSSVALAPGCVMDFCTLEDCIWQHCSWSGVQAAALVSLRCSLRSLDAADSHLQASRWQGTDLTGADFQGARMVGARFERCQWHTEEGLPT